MIYRIFRIPMCCVLALAACSSEPDIPADDPSGTTQLVKNAMIVDDSGAAGYPGDVRFDHDGIIAVGNLEVLDSDEVIFAKGLVLAPGFIDTHSHL